jgi:hypothetical protein
VDRGKGWRARRGVTCECVEVLSFVESVVAVVKVQR